VDDIRAAGAALADYAPSYRPLHQEVRRLQLEARKIAARIENLRKDRTRLARSASSSDEGLKLLDARLEGLDAEKAALENSIPNSWESARQGYVDLAKAEATARREYRNSVDSAYEPVAKLLTVVAQYETLATLGERIEALGAVVVDDPADQAMDTIETVEDALGELDGTSKIKSALSKARRALKGDEPKRQKAAGLVDDAIELYAADMAWRERAAEELLPALGEYDDAIKGSIGLRQQKRLTTAQAEAVASCQSIHRDISLSF